ncbi:MAG: ribonuclease Z [Clostridia bacterium]|nr:ribonuclease Z [Clostridia bacterium]
MNIIVCLDDKNGMLFNKRRQSSDSELINRVLEIVGENKIWINSYSENLFESKKGNIIVDDNFLNCSEAGDYCFVENMDLTPFFEKIENIIIYRWNRNYPSDKKFPVEILSKRWKKNSSFDFKGNSHDKITEEIYKLNIV